MLLVVGVLKPRVTYSLSLTHGRGPSPDVCVRTCLLSTAYVVSSREDGSACSLDSEHNLMEGEVSGATHVAGVRLAVLVFCDCAGSGHGSKNRPAA